MKVLSSFGLILGVGTLYLGLAGWTTCPAAGCPVSRIFLTDQVIPLMIIALSTIGLAFSLRRPRATSR